MVGRLKPGINVEQARDELESISRQLETEHPGSNKGWGVVVVTMVDHMFGQSRTPLLMLFGAVLVMLEIACANIASLQLARAEVSQREFSIRVALGATTGRIAHHLLVESVTLAVLAGVLGLGLAYGLVLTLVRFGPWNIPCLAEINLPPPRPTSIRRKDAFPRSKRN